METKEYFEKCDKAEKWFYESEHGKGRIAGFVPMLMAEYADFYHESEVKKLNIPAVSNSVKIALLKQLEELSDYIPAEIYTKKVIEIQSNFNDC